MTKLNLFGHTVIEQRDVSKVGYFFDIPKMKPKEECMQENIVETILADFSLFCREKTAENTLTKSVYSHACPIVDVDMR